MSSDENAARQSDCEQQPPEQQQQHNSPSSKQDESQQASPQAASQQQQKQPYNNYNERQLTARERLRMDEIAVLEAELAEIDEDALPNARRLLELEIHRLRWGVTDMVDLLGNRRCKIRSKVLIPQDQYPGLNFVGKLLGQGGASLKKLQEESNVKMSILGAGSMRNERKEQECLDTGEAKYQHLKQILHLQIDCLADPAEAYFRIGHALSKVKEAMTPDPNEMAQFYSNHMGPHPHMPHHQYGVYGPASQHHNPHQQPPHHPHHHMPPPPMQHPPPPHHPHNQHQQHPHPYASGPMPPQQQQVPPPSPQHQGISGYRGGGGGRLSGRMGPSAAYNPPIGAMGGGYVQQAPMRGGGRGGGGSRGGGGMRASTGGGSAGGSNGGSGNYEGGPSSDAANGGKNGAGGGASNGGNWHRGATPRGQQPQQPQVASRSGGGTSYMQAAA